jgi:uncharacterized protein YbaP (TraB family)
MKEGKGVVGFETSDFQMDILYGAPLEKQVETLMCFVDNYEEQVEMADFITTAYFAQNLEQLEELNLEEQEGDERHEDETHDGSQQSKQDVVRDVVPAEHACPAETKNETDD